MRVVSGALLLAVFALLSGPQNAGASEGWARFYSGKPAATPRRFSASGDIRNQTICLAAIMDAQTQYDIPNNILLAIGLQEAGRQMGDTLTVWPWTANSHGTGAFFETQAELITWVEAQQARGKSSIDVGCMQVNQRWHGTAFSSLDHATDPAAKVDYAASFLVQLFNETGDWWQAAGRYHSSTDRFKQNYLDTLAGNHQRANAHLQHISELITLPGDQLVARQNGGISTSPLLGWSSELSDGPTNQSFSIYSTQAIEPLLPRYEVTN